MKNLIAFTVLAILSVGFVGCGGNSAFQGTGEKPVNTGAGNQQAEDPDAGVATDESVMTKK